MESSEKNARITGKTLFQQEQEEFLSLVKQAQAGDVMSQYNVGLCYLYGQNTTVDFNEAYQWFERAAKQGDRLAGLFLGYMNELGLGRVINYTQAVNNYKTYSPSISEVDKTALWDEAKKKDENEIEKKLSEIYNKANKIGEAILKIKGFCVYYPKDNSFNFKWNDTTRSEFKKPLEEYNKLVEEFKVYLDAYTSDSDDEKYGYWIYLYEDTLILTYEICNALVGRDTLFRYLDKVGLLAIDKNKNFEFALGRCLIDDNDDTDNDYIISGLLLVAGHDEDPIWQNKVGLWYEFRNENKDLLHAEFWYKKAASLKLSEAQINIDRLKGKKEYKLLLDKSEGTAEDRLIVVKSVRGNEELRNKWLLAAATLGNENATEQLTTTVDVNGERIYNKACDFEPSWKRIELEQVDCKKKSDIWKKQVETDREKYIEEEKRRIKKEEEEARRKAAEEKARRKAAEEEARRKAAEEEARRIQEDVDAMVNEGSNSKKWIWILLVLLLAGTGAWYFFSQNDYSLDRAGTMAEAVDSDSIAVVPEDELIEENTGAHYFLEQFYKKYGDETYLLAHITANVKNKLRNDYDYDCPSNDCLAAWVFTAYPAGADLELEEGPIISETDIDGKFKVDFKYSGYNGEQKYYHTNTVFLTISEIDGNYMISDYEVLIPDVEQENEQEAYTISKEDDLQKTSAGEDIHTKQVSNTQEKQLYSAFFVFGTANELKEYGILDGNGRLLPNYDKNYFTRIDTRVDNKMNLYAKSAKILTPHPTSAYTLMLNENRQYVLNISDPQRFWSSSNYLVILIK